MEKIKTPSFNALDNLAEGIFKTNKNINIVELRIKLSNYLFKCGSKKFVILYNDFAKNKNYKNILNTLNL